MLRRIMTVALVAATIAAPATAQAHRKPGWRHDECRYRNADHHGTFSTAEVAQTIRCAVDHFPVPGGYTFALCIAEHESGLGPFAGQDHSYHGVYQLGDGEFAAAWSARATLWHRWGVFDNTWNARANVLMGITKAHDYGWGAWGTDSTSWGTVRFC